MIQVSSHLGFSIQYKGPTNTRGSRFVATWEGWPSKGGKVRVTIPYDHSARDATEAAAIVAADRFAEWLGNAPGQAPCVRPVRSIRIVRIPGDLYAVAVDLADAAE